MYLDHVTECFAGNWIGLCANAWKGNAFCCKYQWIPLSNRSKSDMFSWLSVSACKCYTNDEAVVMAQYSMGWKLTHTSSLSSSSTIRLLSSLGCSKNSDKSKDCSILNSHTDLLLISSSSSEYIRLATNVNTARGLRPNPTVEISANRRASISIRPIILEKITSSRTRNQPSQIQILKTRWS